MNYNPMLMADFYKLSHREQYPQGTEYVYSTWTPRKSRLPGIDEVVVFGMQGFVKEVLIDYFNENFFKLPSETVINDYKRVVSATLGIKDPDVTHIADLHGLGFLPLLIKALPEGTRVPIRTPILTVQNTGPKFFWLTNFIETMMSQYLWLPSTSATIAFQYKKLLEGYALKTVGDVGFVQFQGHDFSMRGMSSLNSSCTSGAGHLLSFVGTDTIPAIQYLEKYYGADVTKELVGTSIPATEHSVMCAYQDDKLSFKRLLTEIYPNGFVSVVSDTWDLWDVVCNILPSYKDIVMARDGRVVIRPDSGDPVLILCGDPDASTEHERKGVIEVLWDNFGGTTTPKGYKLLDSHVGCIYGDAITLERCEEICKRLEAKGFASINAVYGIGSYTYQFNTRDTFGFALKSTLCSINGHDIQIFKDPKTSDGEKKSQKGRVIVNEDKTWTDGHGFHVTEAYDMLQPIFRNGYACNVQTLAEVRARLLQ